MFQRRSACKSIWARDGKEGDKLDGCSKHRRFTMKVSTFSLFNLWSLKNIDHFDSGHLVEVYNYIQNLYYRSIWACDGGDGHKLGGYWKH